MEWGWKMKTVQMTLGETLVAEVDRIVKELGTTRSEFTRRALKEALLRHRERELERRQREGYRRHPVRPDEFSDWESEQVWGD